MKRGASDLIIILALVMLTPAVLASDILVWQGQYYTGNTFNTGTYDFNFTVYDAVSGGESCYSNITSLTTGNFGEWGTEQYGVISSCNNASQSYFLEIKINNVTQGERRRLTNLNFLRKDVQEVINTDLTIQGNLYTSNNISSEGNIESNFGLFTYIGSLINRVTKLFVNDITASGNINASNYTLNGTTIKSWNEISSIVTDSGCLIPHSNFWAEEAGGISSTGGPAGLEYSFGDSDVSNYGPRQPCSGRVVYLSIQAITAENGNGRVDIVINGGSNSTCNVSTPSSAHNSTASQCNLQFNSGDRIAPRTTTSPTGTNNGYVVSWWVVYD